MSVLKEAEKYYPNILFIRADSKKLPFKDKEFQLVSMIDLIEHVENPELTIKEANRIAEYALIKVPMEDNMFINLYKFFVKTDWKKMEGHINMFNYTSINKLMEENGFKLIKYEIPKSVMVKQKNWKLWIMNIIQCVSNMFSDKIKTYMAPVEFIGFYKAE